MAPDVAAFSALWWPSARSRPPSSSTAATAHRPRPPWGHLLPVRVTSAPRRPRAPSQRIDAAQHLSDAPTAARDGHHRDTRPAQRRRRHAHRRAACRCRTATGRAESAHRRLQRDRDEAAPGPGEHRLHRCAGLPPDRVQRVAAVDEGGRAESRASRPNRSSRPASTAGSTARSSMPQGQTVVASANNSILATCTR